MIFSYFPTLCELSEFLYEVIIPAMLQRNLGGGNDLPHPELSTAVIISTVINTTMWMTWQIHLNYV